MGGEGPNPAQLRRQSNRLRIAGAIIIIFLIFAGLFEITRRNGFHFFMTSSSMENGSPEQSPSSSALATTPTTSSSAPFASSTLHGYPPDNKELIASWCNLPPVAKQPVDGFKESGRLMGKDIRQRQIDRLSAAINVPTESHDDLGEFGRDRRWEKFDYLHKVLQAHFPRVHSNTTVEKINKYGLLYTWKGHNEKLKPILFAAHQDVVRAGPWTKWKHPPYKAFYDKNFIWGRGSAGSKNNLIGLLSVVEELLEQRFEPQRTVILAFGFDEEVGGSRGAKHISQYLEKKYGKDSLAMILDEGGNGIHVVGSLLYAVPAVQEKGFLDIMLFLEVPGGESLSSPDFTGIGIMSKLVAELESNAFPPKMTAQNPLKNLLQCYVRHSRKEVENFLPSALAGDQDALQFGARLTDRGSLKYNNKGKDMQFLVQTSQAVDVIRGGEKGTQLPDSVNVTINYRIASHESVEDVRKHVVDVIYPVAHKHGIAVKGFGYDEPLSNYPAGALTFSSSGELEPSPISPTDDKNGVWKLFAGTIRQVFENVKVTALDAENAKESTVIPAGSVMLSNTDTQHYLSLTKNIYRFTPARDGTRVNTHGIDERLDMDAHLEGMRLYYDLMRNFDAVDDEGLA